MSSSIANHFYFILMWTYFIFFLWLCKFSLLVFVISSMFCKIVVQCSSTVSYIFYIMTSLCTCTCFIIILWKCTLFVLYCEYAWFMYYIVNMHDLCIRLWICMVYVLYCEYAWFMYCIVNMQGLLIILWIWMVYILHCEYEWFMYCIVNMHGSCIAL